MTPIDLDSLLPSPQPKRVWSPYQLEVYRESADPHLNIHVEAVAGGAKTSTLVETARRLNGYSLFLAFNKSIASELASRVTQSTTVRTLNALGHGILTRKRPGAQFNQWKVHNYLRSNMSADLYQLLGPAVGKVVSVAKGSALGIGDSISDADFERIAEDYCPDIEDSPAIAKIAGRAFFDSVSNTSEFDFDDQLYVPILEGWTFPSYPTVFVDEAQDLNRIQHLMLRALVNRGARIIAVGDRHQAIYGFRGALSDSMDKLLTEFQGIELPLSITYRCAKVITALAQTMVPQIQCADSAPEGQIINHEQYPELSFYRDGDLVVCRNNAPIFGLALQFLRARVHCRVMSSFLEEIEKFIRGFKVRTSAQLQSKLDAWYERQKDDRRPWRAEACADKYETLSAFCKEFFTVDAILSAIRTLSTSISGPRISTIHRAKGLEADRAIMLRYDLLPSPKAITPEQLAQEENLRYVAITRAKSELHFLPNT